MRWSRYYVPTLKEAPAEAEVISHQLLIRAGMIRKVMAGVYSYLPMGWRAVEKVAQVVREEMDRAGALEIMMPAAQPGDLWKESGRWEAYGKELLRFNDRHERECCLGPTHEEVITDLVRGELRSYRQLPVNMYHIQTKFRDEIRPRYGLMRGREFIMKDAYSFDKDDAGADKSYEAMFEAYKRIFTRLGMRFRAVEADSGSIGGSFSHEFMVLADTGEDTIAVCNDCDYAANLEKAQIKGDFAPCAEECAAPEYADTPGKHTVDEVADFLGIDATKIIKTLLFDADGEIVAALVRGDRELNDVKLKNLLDCTHLEMASPEQVKNVTGAPVGFAGPGGLNVERVYADLELQSATDWVAGGNKGDAHVLHLDLKRDAKITEYADLRMITEDDPCPHCGGGLFLTKGIEVGHVFKLGLKYSEAMNAVFLDENGKERHMVMGCYGIGVTRIVAACIEQNHDDGGIIFPPNMAPYEVLVINLTPKDESVTAKADELYAMMNDDGIETLLDDRKERPGVKFKDADLIGAPMQIVVGGKGLGNGIIEAKDRRSGEKTELPVEGFAEAFAAWREQVKSAWPS